MGWDRAKQGYLSEVDIFRDLSPEEVEALGRRAPMRTVPVGTVIYAPDDAGEILFILKVGRVRLYRLSPDGKAFTMAIVEAGAIFGRWRCSARRCATATPRRSRPACSA